MADSTNNDIHAQEGSEGSARVRRSSQRAAGSDLMRYARDNRFVRAVYSFTTGRTRPLFIILVVAVVAVAVYLPVRDLYIAYRSQTILEEQIAIREAYNEELEEEVEALTTEEGVQDAAREELGMVMEGETPLTVTGLDEDGNAIVVETESSDAASDDDESEDDSGSDDESADEDADGADEDAETSSTEDGDGSEDASTDDADDAETDASESEDAVATSAGEDDAETDTAEDEDDETMTSADVDAAVKAVYENSAWYWKVLDAIFFFDGTTGQAVVSTGE